MIRLGKILTESTYNDVEKELKSFDSAYNRADDNRAYKAGKEHHAKIMAMASSLSDSDIKKLEKKYDVILKGKSLPKEAPYKEKQFGKYTVSKDPWGFRVDNKSGMHDFEVASKLKSEKEAIKIAQDADKKYKEREKKRASMGESVKLTKMIHEAIESPEAEALAEAMKNTVQKIFPKSYVNAYFSTNLAPSITLKFTIGNRNDYANGIEHNDPARTIFMIHNPVDKDGKLKDVLVMERIQGGGLAIQAPPGSFLAFERHKVKYRVVKGDSKKIIQGLDKYFKNLKVELKNVLDKFKPDDAKIVKGKI